jgi:hypothetical protein
MDVVEAEVIGEAPWEPEPPYCDWSVAVSPNGFEFQLKPDTG